MSYVLYTVLVLLSLSGGTTASEKATQVVRRPVKRLVVSGYVVSLRFSPDGKHLAVGDVRVREKTPESVRVFDTETWKQVAHLQNETICGYSPDGEFLATVSLGEVLANARFSLYRVSGYRQDTT